MTSKKLAARIAMLMAISLPLAGVFSGPATAFGGGFGGSLGVGGVSDPLKYYPICPRGPASENCQCRVAGDTNPNRLCSPGDYCDPRNGICTRQSAPGGVYRR
jgi:hypothetical protein